MILPRFCSGEFFTFCSFKSFLEQYYTLSDGRHNNNIPGYIIDGIMWGMEIGKRLSEKRMRNTADIRKDVWLVLEWHLRYIVGRQA